MGNINFQSGLKQIHAIIIHYAVTTGPPISGQNTTSTAQGITLPACPNASGHPVAAEVVFLLYHP